MRVVGIEGMTVGEIEQAVNQGGRFVIFEYCISVLILTFKRGSDIRFVKPGESAIRRGLDCSAVTVLLGWWGIPWGPIYSVMALYTNLGGGRDVTDAMMAVLRGDASAPAPAAAPQNSPASTGSQPRTFLPVSAPVPALAILTASGRLRCPRCGHEGSPSRHTCKQCRTPLLKTPSSTWQPATPLPPRRDASWFTPPPHSVSPLPSPAAGSGPMLPSRTAPAPGWLVPASSDPCPTPPLGTLSPLATSHPPAVEPAAAPRPPA